MAGKRQKKQDGVNRENFTTNIDSDLLHKFRIYCVTNNVYQNDVIEKFMKDLLKKEGSEEVGNSN